MCRGLALSLTGAVLGLAWAGLEQARGLGQPRRAAARDAPAR